MSALLLRLLVRAVVQEAARSTAATCRFCGCGLRSVLGEALGHYLSEHPARSYALLATAGLVVLAASRGRR